MRAIVIFLTLSVVGLLLSCQQRKNKESLTKQNVEIVKPALEKVKESVPEEIVKPVEEMNYYVVAGCFEFYENAERLNTLLLKEGFKSQIVPFYNLTMVTYGGYKTRKEAQVALNKMVLEPGKETCWVYPLR